jgi:hypothetical protein
MRPQFLTAALVATLSLAHAGSNDAQAASTYAVAGELANRKLDSNTVHCACIADAGRRYNPNDAYDDANMPTLQVEEAMRRWAQVEALYGACMRQAGVVPQGEAFPHGVSDYADGPEFHPAGCSVSNSVPFPTLAWARSSSGQI